MSNDESSAKQGKPQRRPTRADYEGLIEQRIQQAQEDGLFDNLPGTGKPLKLDDDSLVPDTDRAAYRMLKSNNFTLPWIAARQEIDEYRSELESWLTSTNRRWPQLPLTARAQMKIVYRRKLDTLQQMIMTFNLKAPKGIAQLETLRLADELERLGATT